MTAAGWLFLAVCAFAFAAFYTGYTVGYSEGKQERWGERRLLLQRLGYLRNEEVD